MVKEVKVENQTEDDCLIRFLNRCDGSEKTQKSYRYQLDKFKEWTEFETYSALLEAPDAELARLLENYIMYLKGKVSPNSVAIYFAPIKKFYQANKKKLDFENIEDAFPKKVRKSGKEAYSDEDMKTMLRHALKKRTRALLLFIAATGCRAGAIPSLQMQHVENIGEGCKAVRIYGESLESEEYWAYLTPEASKALDEYWSERTGDGEFFKKESPVFRTDYDIAIATAKPMKEGQVLEVFRTLAQHITSRRKVSAHRYNIQIVHGVRKWQSKKVKKNSGISFSTSEKLAGRKAYLDGEYYPITKEEGFEQFKKIIADLTLDDSARKNLQIEEQQKEIEELKEKEKKIQELSDRLLKVEEERDESIRDSVKEVVHYAEFIMKIEKMIKEADSTDGSKNISEHNSNEGETE